MILRQRDDLNYFDMRGVYIKECTVGPKAGLHVVELNRVVIHVKYEQLMDLEEYFDILNKRKPGPLPELAVGIPWFLAGDYKGSY